MCAKAVKTEQPVRLIEPVLAQERRLGVERGQKRILYHRHIRGVKHALEPVLIVKRLREVQNVQVIVRRCADDELRGLSGRRKFRRMAVLDELLPVLHAAVADLCHGAQDALLRLVRSERFETRFAWQLNIDAEPVGKKSKLFDQLRRCAGDRLGVDIAVEAIRIAQDRQRADHQLRRVVRRAQDAGGEEEPFNIVAAKEADRQLRKLFRREGRARRVVRTAVDAVFAVVAAVV